MFLRESLSRLFACFFLLLSMLGSGIFAQSTVNKAVSIDSTVRDDPDFARAVKEWTTRPEFMSPLVDHLPKVAGVPSPKDALGYHIGTPKKLTRTSEIYKYYRDLASSSPRVKVIN